MSVSEYGMALGFISGITGFLWFVVEIIFLVVALGPVKRERPDAWVPFVASIAVDLVGTALHHGGIMVAGFWLEKERLLSVMLVIQLVTGVLSIGARGLLIFGVVRLARTPPALSA